MASCIVILGTPRSGTSCVAGIVHHLGISMGERLMPADEWNPAGYFQDLDFEEILHAGLGYWNFPTWDDLIAAKDTNKFHIEASKTLRQTGSAIKNLAAQRAASGETWGVKSNRLAFFLNQLIAGAGDVRIIRTSRPEADSVASWKARSSYTDEEAAKPIRFMKRAIDMSLARSNASPALTVDFNALLADVPAGVQSIADACGVPVTQEALDFVNADLRRFGE